MATRTQKNREHIILAIDPGTREMGAAVLDGTHLRFAGVKTFPPKLPYSEGLKRIRAELLRLISDHKPNLIAVEHTLFANNPTSRLLNEIEGQVKALAKRQRIPVLVLASSRVKKDLCGNGIASKSAVAKAVVAQYPSLRIFLNQNKKWKRRYHANMFDAVALAMVAREKALWANSSGDVGKRGGRK